MKTDMSEHIHRHKDSHIEHSATSVNRIFVFCVVINLLFVIAEVIVGLYSDSMSLLSDAGHNMGDVFSLLLVLFAFHIAKLRGNDRFTYGYKRGTILISLVNALILIVTVGVIVFESIRRLQVPVAVAGEVIGWTAGAGIIVNGVTTILLMRGRKSDLNIRGAFLHMLTDTLVSVGVVISGLLLFLRT